MHKKQLILDTTVCIDLFNGKLLRAATRLPYELALPDVIVDELINPSGRHLLQIGYSVLHLPPEAIEKVTNLRERYTKPSTNDLFALLLAKLHSCELITGDDALRKAAHREKVTTHGVLWLLDRLVEHNILTPEEAADALKNILAGGSWLPNKECEARLKHWKQ